MQVLWYGRIKNMTGWYNICWAGCWWQSISTMPSALPANTTIPSLSLLWRAPIFFVSVGMLVDPKILVEYAVPILALVGTILVGQAIFGITVS